MGIILDAINEADDSPILRETPNDVSHRLQDALDAFTCYLETSGNYDSDKKLSVFDKTFEDAGWEGYGFRHFKDGSIVHGNISDI